MNEVAILGAGELGGALAHVLARRDAARVLRIVDDAGRIAEGKALDIAESAPIDGFATELTGSADLMDAAGAQVIAIADRARGGEWRGDDAVLLLRRIHRLAPGAIIVCAGPEQRDLVERGVRELHGDPRRIIGSAPDALAAAVKALVALDQNVSPRDVSISVVGVPPTHCVVAWEGASIAGVSLTRAMGEPARRRLAAKIPSLWPPGPYALASAAAKAIETIAGRSRRLACCFVAPDDTAGIKARTAALPVRLGADGIVEVVRPALSVAERVALDNAMLL